MINRKGYFDICIKCKLERNETIKKEKTACPLPNGARGQDTEFIQEERFEDPDFLTGSSTRVKSETMTSAGESLFGARGIG